MVRVIISLVIFVGALASLGYGALWFVDHKHEISLRRDEAKSSLSSILANSQKELQEENKKNDQAPASETEQRPVEQGIAPTKNITEKTALSIAVLNGGGPAGSAKKMADILISQGYTKTKATNAKSYTHKNIVVYFAKEKRSDAENIQNTIKKNYPNTSLLEASETEHKQADIVIIIGE